ncbi:uncharacterized protein [Temnothorax longispinosus]|uniref:uncharacterized protein n=1 Tax=Temnothorax longispinosus TaxID=300112 RepID=UPI003A99D3AD
MTSSDKESKRPNKSKSGQSVKHMKQELNRLRLMTKNLENSGGEEKCVNKSEKENISNTFKKLNDSEVITYKNSHFSSQMEVDTPCTKTKDEELLELGSDTEFAPDANECLDKNTDENNSPSMLDSRPYLRKRSRLAFYPVKNNANATENSATTLVNNTSESSEDVIYPSPTQSPTLASKVKQYLKLKRKIPVKRIDFGLCPSPKHTSMQMENVSILKDKVNTSYLLPIKVHNKTDIEDETFYLPAEQTANRNKMDDFNLDDTENKPPKKKRLSKRKDISEQLNMRCKADRAKVNGQDCWECREYYNMLSLSKEEL